MIVNFRNTRFSRLAAVLTDCPDDGLPEIVISGRSNVGKSSLINALCDNKKLARVSSDPGKTRAVIYFNVDKKLYLADLPGYGYARTSKESIANFSKLTDTYLSSGREFALVLHLMDVRHTPSKEDSKMLEFLNASGIPYFAVFTKCDKFSRSQLEKRISEIEQELDFDENANVFMISSESRLGLEDLRNSICEVLDKL